MQGKYLMSSKAAFDVTLALNSFSNCQNVLKHDFSFCSFPTNFAIHLADQQKIDRIKTATCTYVIGLRVWILIVGHG